MKEIEGKHAILQTEVAKLRCLFTSVEVAVKPLKPLYTTCKKLC